MNPLELWHTRGFVESGREPPGPKPANLGLDWAFLQKNIMRRLLNFKHYKMFLSLSEVQLLACSEKSPRKIYRFDYGPDKKQLRTGFWENYSSKICFHEECSFDCDMLEKYSFDYRYDDTGLHGQLQRRQRCIQE